MSARAGGGEQAAREESPQDKTLVAVHQSSRGLSTRAAWEKRSQSRQEGDRGDAFITRWDVGCAVLVSGAPVALSSSSSDPSIVKMSTASGAPGCKVERAYHSGRRDPDLCSVSRQIEKQLRLKQQIYEYGLVLATPRNSAIAYRANVRRIAH
eukprot:307108-Hanusia_phi.AAC.1